jgi:putative ABC transport system ATP-binding protein
MIKEMQPDRATLHGRHLTRTYGEGDTAVRALAGVSLDLYPGEVAFLMGPSGSGKTTLLAVLSGLLRPTSGQVVVLGQDLWEMSERQRERFRMRHCGFVFQEHNLFSSLTARQQLEIVLRWGMRASAREARARTDAMLALLGLAKKGHLRPLELSGGEKQRVAVGRALVKGPTFCFADEPTSSLDWGNGERVVELLRHAAHEQGGTVLVVGHDARMVDYVDRVYGIEDGSLQGRSPPDRAAPADGLAEETGQHPPAVDTEGLAGEDRGVKLALGI